MEGQPRLISLINSLTLQDFPHTLLLLGERGCGKHLLCSYIANKFGLEMSELDNKITVDDVENILQNSTPTLYFVDLEGTLPKVQNTLLKILEEPPENALFVCINTGTFNILPTLLNRCCRWLFEPYSKEILLKFIKEENSKTDLLLEIAHTPGQVIAYQEYPLLDELQLATNIIDKIGIASYSSVLNIAEKISFKEGDGKFELHSFLAILNKCFLDKIREDSSPKYLDAFKLLANLPERLNFSIVKQRAFEEFLFNLKEVLA